MTVTSNSYFCTAIGINVSLKFLTNSHNLIFQNQFKNKFSIIKAKYKVVKPSYVMDSTRDHGTEHVDEPPPKVTILIIFSVYVLIKTDI